MSIFPEFNEKEFLNAYRKGTKEVGILSIEEIKPLVVKALAWAEENYKNPVETVAAFKIAVDYLEKTYDIYMAGTNKIPKEIIALPPSSLDISKMDS